MSPYRQRLRRFFRALSWHSRYFLCKSLRCAGDFLTVVQKPCERSISPMSSPFLVRVTCEVDPSRRFSSLTENCSGDSNNEMNSLRAIEQESSSDGGFTKA